MSVEKRIKTFINAVVAINCKSDTKKYMTF